MLLNVGGRTVSLLTVGVALPICADISLEGGSVTTFGVTGTAYVKIRKVALLAFDGINAVAGTAAIAALLLLRATVTPADGAA